MDKKDQDIKRMLENMQAPITDPHFTDGIVNRFLVSRNQKVSLLQIDFSSLMTGLIATTFAFFITYTNEVYGIGLTPNQLSVIQILPILYMIFQLLNEFLNHKDKIVFGSPLVFRGLIVFLSLGIIISL